MLGRWWKVVQPRQTRGQPTRTNEADESTIGARLVFTSSFRFGPKNSTRTPVRRQTDACLADRLMVGLAFEPGAEYLGRRVLPEVQAPPPETTIEAVSPRPSALRPLLAALVTTILVTALSYFAPAKHAATLVGLAFLAATWWLVLRGDEHVIREHGLSLGGLLEPLALDKRRMARDTLIAIAWVLLFVLIVFPPFWFGFKLFWHAKMPFVWRAPKSPLDEVAGQLLVVALPEEAFFRGYLQTRLDAAWGKRTKFLGAEIGLGWLVSAIIFAVGHLLTTPMPARLAVFFPALLFGWLRARTGGIGAGVLFHALCNMYSATLARGYGMSL